MFVALLVYVDDIIIASSYELAVQKLKSNLDAKFKLKDLGPLRSFLGYRLLELKKAFQFHKDHMLCKFWKILVFWVANQLQLLWK